MDVKAPEVQGFDHLELAVGNARQAAYYYSRAFGFDVIAYAGPETGKPGVASYVLQQGKIRLVLTTPLSDRAALAQCILKHGDTVRDVAFTVPDVEVAYQSALARGAIAVQDPVEEEDEQGVLRRATIQAYGDVVHSFIESRHYRGVHAPGFVGGAQSGLHAGADLAMVGLKSIDHVVANVEEGRMDEWVEFYARVFGFTQLISFDDRDISTQYSSLRSKVMRDSRNIVKLPINEPAQGLRRSQIQEYLDFHQGPGVQHVALNTRRILDAVPAMQARGVEFLKVPPSYYEHLAARIGRIREPLDELSLLHILADRDERGYLLQIFTHAVEDRPTLFFEVIQREGSESFGKGNFKELFEAIEREQARRGNLQPEPSRVSR